jgi:hypothetical protein
MSSAADPVVQVEDERFQREFEQTLAKHSKAVVADSTKQQGPHTALVKAPSGPVSGNPEKLHTLSELPASRLAQMSWLERGQWLVQANAGYLAQARAKPFKSITLVSAMVDLGRGSLGGGFARPFSAYVARMRQFMAYDFPKVVFLDADHLGEFQALIDTSPGPVHVVPISKADIKAGFRHFDALQAVRTRREWAHRKEWLSHSPQATLEYYNPLVMSKMNLTVQAAALNPFSTDGFLFIDGGHLCNAPGSIKAATHGQSIIDRFMRDGIAITYYDYVPDQEDGEIHGFEAAAFHRYMGTEEEPIRVGRGGFFGGRPELLQLGAQLIDVIAEDTLKHGYLGTEGKAALQYITSLCFIYPLRRELLCAAAVPFPGGGAVLR